MEAYDGDGISRRRFLQHLGLGAGVVGAGLFPGDRMAGAKDLLARTPQQARSVIVVGAGLAGLAAAWELDEAGHEVTVLEARTRPGGRVHTLREPFSGELFAETGAVAFSETYTEAARYIEELGLERGPWDLRDLAPLFHLRGERLTGGEDGIDWPYELSEDERGLVPMELLGKYIFETLPSEIGTPERWSEPPLSELDELSLGGYLRQQGASSGAVELIADTQFFGPRIESTSTLSTALAEFGLFFGGAPFVLVNGNDGLPRGMASRLGRSVKYGLEVTGLRDTGRGVEVTARRGDRIETYEADRAIVAVPLGVLRRLDFTPRLAPRKQRAVREVPYIDATRTFLQVDRAFWFDEGVSGNAATDLPVGLVYRHPLGDAAGPEQRSIVEGYVIDSAARGQATLSDPELVELIVSEMEKVHPGIAQHVEGTAVKAWGRDPYAVGHVSWPAPGDVTSHLQALQSPHGRIHFAGEHTTVLRGTMEGALRSGIRAAGEVSGDA